MSLRKTNYYMKAGNLQPPLTLYLEDGQGRIPGFSGVDDVDFFIWKKGSSTYDVHRFGSVADASQAKVQLFWQAGETDDPGVYHVLVDLIRDGERETYPGQGTGTLVIEDRPAIA